MYIVQFTTLGVSECIDLSEKKADSYIAHLNNLSNRTKKWIFLDIFQRICMKCLELIISVTAASARLKFVQETDLDQIYTL